MLNTLAAARRLKSVFIGLMEFCSTLLNVVPRYLFNSLCLANAACWRWYQLRQFIEYDRRYGPTATQALPAQCLYQPLWSP